MILTPLVQTEVVAIVEEEGKPYHQPLLVLHPSIHPSTLSAVYSPHPVPPRPSERREGAPKVVIQAKKIT